ncbi:hypothetical protein AAC387_Pa03g1943 [Persea americana]
MSQIFKLKWAEPIEVPRRKILAWRYLRRRRSYFRISHQVIKDEEPSRAGFGEALKGLFGWGGNVDGGSCLWIGHISVSH